MVISSGFVCFENTTKALGEDTNKATCEPLGRCSKQHKEELSHYYKGLICAFKMSNCRNAISFLHQG